MTAPAPSPPLLVRARLRLRWARRRARYAAARHLRRLTALLDPPPEHIERARVADLALLGVPPPTAQNRAVDLVEWRGPGARVAMLRPRGPLVERSHPHDRPRRLGHGASEGDPNA
jgi:hypothetical protein